MQRTIRAIDKRLRDGQIPAKKIQKYKKRQDDESVRDVRGPVVHAKDSKSGDGKKGGKGRVRR